MLKNMKIGAQIILVTFSLVIITILGLSLTSNYFFSGYAEKVALEGANLGNDLLRDFIEAEKLKVREFRNQLAINEMLVRHVINKDTESLNTDLFALMQAAGIDILVVADADGTVLSRPHDPERRGDSIANDENVKMALSGQTWDMLMSAPSTRLGYYSGAPIKMGNGRIIGMFRAAVSLEKESIVDRIKALCHNEVTLFAGKTRKSTTIMEDGKRVINTDASESVAQAVLQEGKDLELSLRLFGKEYFAVYRPLRDLDSGEIMGMYFSGKSTEESKQAIRSTIMGIAGVSVVVFVIAFIEIGRAHV